MAHTGKSKMVKMTSKNIVGYFTVAGIMVGNLKGKDVARIYIEPSPHPVYVSHEDKSFVYLRTGNGTRSLGVEEALSYIAFHWKNQEIWVMKQARLKILQQMPIFGGLNKDSLLFLMDLSPSVIVRTGDFFFHEQQKSGTMYVLEKGKVAVLKSWNSQNHLLAYLSVGDCFGELELLDLCPRAASVMATTDCIAIQISTASLFSLHKENLEQFTLIQMNMGRELSRRLRKLDQEIFSIKCRCQANHGFFLSHEEIIAGGTASS